MRKIALVLGVVLILASCTSDNNSSNDNNSMNDSQSLITKCPIIRSLESSSKGDFMIVNISGDLNNNNLSDREKYKITNINNYHLGQRICNLKDFGNKIDW